MFFIRPVQVAKLCRGISSSAHLHNMGSMISAQQQARMMNKMLAAAKKKERLLMNPAALEPASDVSDSPVSGSGSGSGPSFGSGSHSVSGSGGAERVRIRALRAGSARHRHRLEALSAIYLQRLTELLGTGELLADLADTGLAVTRVQLSGNMRLLYVFWTCSAAADERRVASRLDDGGRALRTALTQQRVTGHVPGIKFVRDLESSCLQEVERRLAVADYGPDFVPTDPTHLVKRQGVLGLPLTARHTEHLLGSDGDAADFTLELPHTAGGLNRAAILAEVEERLQKASAPHRQVELHPEAVTPTVPEEGAAGRAERELMTFEKFTKQRKWARMRQNRVSNNVDLREWELSRRRRSDDALPEEDGDDILPDDSRQLDTDLPSRA